MDFKELVDAYFGDPSPDKLADLKRAITSDITFDPTPDRPTTGTPGSMRASSRPSWTRSMPRCPACSSAPVSTAC